MKITRIKLKNWRNFQTVDVALQERMFFIGANASGKSNLLDVFRFLRDIAKTEGGGFQKAVRDRGGVSKIRNLAARRDPEITIEIHLSESQPGGPEWKYSIGFIQETHGHRVILLTHEKVWQEGKLIIDRPDPNDQKDATRLTQTFLEQINSNEKFRAIAGFLDSTVYLHLVPQLIRFGESMQSKLIENDPFGQAFLQRVAKTPKKTRDSWLSRIEKALTIAVPQLSQLRFQRDVATGQPHLEAVYKHWRARGAKQREDQFSDGTLRLLGLLWSLLEGNSLLLLEEPELSLNGEIVSQLAPLIYRLQKQRKRQVFMTTHSPELLRDRGVDGREVLLLTPANEGTSVQVAAEIPEVKALLEADFAIADAVLPRTNPPNSAELGKFK